MPRIFSIVICLLLYSLCNCKNVRNNNASLKGSIIVLQSLGKFPEKMLSFLQDSISKFYPLKIVIAPAKLIPFTFYYTPHNRYRADSIIRWLTHMRLAENQVIAGVTAYDISASKGATKDYGIMGLGYEPGKASITSTFRLKPNSPSEEILKQRLLKTIVHEIGHNFGLPHCKFKYCIMADAEGKLNQDNEQGFCNNCKKKLALQYE